MSSGCGDVLSLEDLKTAKKHQTFEAEVITGRAGGVSSGAEIDYSTNSATGQVQKTMPAILRDIGFQPASFDFTSGGTLTTDDRDKVIFNPADNNWYSWAGSLPHIVAAGTDPTTDTDWIPRVDPSLRADLDAVTADYEAFKNTLASDSGVSLIGGWTSPEAFNVVPDSQAAAHANSKALFNMFESIRAAGSGVVWLKPGAVYWVDYLNFIPSNCTIMGNGATIKHIDPISSYGRGGLIVGSSYEWNYDKAKAAYLADSYPASVLNTGATDPTITQYLEFNQSFVQAENVIINDLRMEAFFTLGTSWGGYAINCVNAQHVRIFNLRTKGWTQSLNFGSDVGLSTPSCFDVKAFGVTIEQPDLVRTYYSLGFMANSTECEISDWNQVVAMTAGTQNGSAASMNACKRCKISRGRVPSLGLTVSSEGVLLNNCQLCVVEDIDIRNCTSVVSTFYSLTEFSTTADRNVIRGISGQGTRLISLRAKNAVVESFNRVDDSTIEIYFGNNNCTGNKIRKEPLSMAFGGSNNQAFFLQNNEVKGWERRYFYLRPADMLIYDRADTSSMNDNITVASKTGVDLQFLWQVTPGIKAIDDIRTFITFAANAQAAGSNIAISLTQMAAFDGNISTSALVLMTNNKTADGTTDTTLVAQASSSNVNGLVKMGDTDNTDLSAVTQVGLAYSHYVRARMTNNVNFNYIKHFRIAGYI